MGATKQSQKQAGVLQRDNEKPAVGHGVVIADDDAAIRTMCRYMLEAEGLRCAEAADGEQALHLTKEGFFDLALLDVDMPGLTGAEVLHRLRENPPAPHMKVIMMSGRVKADEMSPMMAGG